MANLSNFVPVKIPRTNRRFIKWCSCHLLTLLGWQISGSFPNEKKLILAVAPHTSNWDFVIGVIVKLALDLKLNFLGKDAIFIWPFNIWLESIGGIAIDRKSAHGVVGQMVDKFGQQETLVLALAPEGTRSKVHEWKSGFLHIANKANVPVLPIQIDYKGKQVIFYQARNISADIDDELQDIKSIFSKDCAKNPHNF
ncbi:1-acyl-sn-glycerol-3-phosphate acyltransferase [Thalassotalea psychrophila]|uniref:1-acyl-sn-glycerol-3-phosphate acyltransferase n=1 Tax=Thalassotalea psychrophila TaxID=3065647 RepID=A0ABY9TR20_9GAMM|nr:1-acyl-sn-glycerol-3-phosphate acyltransferase [Colwelliaceae bacterium SQ149]